MATKIVILADENENRLNPRTVANQIQFNDDINVKNELIEIEQKIEETAGRIYTDTRELEAKLTQVKSKLTKVDKRIIDNIKEVVYANEKRNTNG